MKKVRTRKIVIVLAVVVVLLAAYLLYSRPMTLSQLYPVLPLDECTGIRGYYEVGMQAAQTEFTVERDSEEFQALCDLFYGQSYRRSLKDLLPRGTRIHRTQPDDFQWEVFFSFENVEFPDGSSGSGSMLHIQSWYGELDIYFDRKTYSCHTKDQKIWEREILDIIRH